MNIEQLDATRILISLGDRELESYDVTFENLSFSELRGRKLLREMLRRAANTTGIDLKDKHVVIEALKYEHGCLLLLTITDRVKKRRTYRIKYQNDAYLFLFGDAGSLLDCIRALYRMNGRHFSSSVYYYHQKYYLVLYGTASVGSRYLHTIGEFCISRKRSKAFNASLMEHARVISLKRAVETIGSQL